MASLSDSSPGPEIQDAIQVLERSDLDHLSTIDLSLYTKENSGTLPWDGAKFDFIRVRAIARNIAENKTNVERFMMEDVLAGLHGLKTPFIYLIIGSRLEIKIYLGILNKQTPKPTESFFSDVLTCTLKSTFPDIEVEYLTKDMVDAQIIHFFNKCKHFGVMSGIPTAKLGVEEHGVEQVERLIRGLYQEEFGYMVIADPIADQDVVDAFDDITQIIRDKSGLIKEVRQYTQTSRMTMSGETINRSVQYFVELLEALLAKLKLSKIQGMWRTTSYFFSPEPSTAGKMSSLLKTVFSGEESVPEAIRTIILHGISPLNILGHFKQIELELNFHPAYSTDHPLRKVIKHKFVTALSSRDLATLSHLPKEEMPGYDVKDTARFGVCCPERDASDSLFLGEIMDRGNATGSLFGIPTRDLVKHGLIVGVTGSGKTNTCLCLLDQLWKGPTKTPFMVIEPAKTEYRSLSNIEGYNALQIFTLGDELTSPFRLNPFEIMNGVKLQTHIDNLRAVFNASFIMYAPMPYVLEQCIHGVYKDKGWNLTTNRNRFLDSGGHEHHAVFPTLSDLYNKIDDVVDSLGYEKRITMDIKAGLKTRIGSLRIGGKGSMLDTAFSIPMDTLLAKPTVLELQSIGDDEEKAFLMGLIITRLYEYRDIEARRSGSNTGLKHMTLVEEAHRLLAKTSSDMSNLENVSTKAKAVETFCNMLSEIRALGEGVLIAEQIPVKLAQDAIKNTNLKIMHRVVAKDDRDIMGHTMNLNEKQNIYVSIMERGSAVVFSEGFSEPFLVKVPPYKTRADFINSEINTVHDVDVRAFMSEKLKYMDNIFGKQPGCNRCRRKCVYRDTTDLILAKPGTMSSFTSFIYTVVEKPDAITTLYHHLKECFLKNTVTSINNDNEADDILFCTLITAGERFFRNRAKQYNLLVDKAEELLGSYLNFVNAYFSILASTKEPTEGNTCLEEFRRCFMGTFSAKEGPFPGCNEYCKYRCLFRYDVEPLVADEGIQDKYRQIIWNANEIQERTGLKKYCMEIAQNMTITNSKAFIENIALCFFIQKSVQDSIKEVLANVRKWFFDMEETA